MLRWSTVLGFTFLSFLAAVFVLQGVLWKRFVLPRVAQALRDSLGLECSIDALAVGLDGVLRVNRLQTLGGAPTTGVLSLGLAHAEISLDWAPLLSGGAPAVAQVVLVEPSLTLHLDRSPVFPSAGGGSGSGSKLPGIEVRDADLKILTKVDELHLEGVDLALVGSRASLRVRAGEGSWSPPRLAALRFPLEIDAALGPGEFPWSEIQVSRLALGGAVASESFLVSIEPGGAVSLSGDLPGWGVSLRRGLVTASDVDLLFDAQEADLHGIVALFTSWPAPFARGKGVFHLVLPLRKLSDWRLDTDLELADLDWPGEGLAAHVARVQARRSAPGGPLEGEVLAADLTWKGLRAAGLTARFERTFPGTPDVSPRLSILEGTLLSGAGALDVAGTLDERSLTVETLHAEAIDLTGGAVEQSGLAGAASLPGEGSLSLGLDFRGSLLDPGSWAGSFEGSGSWARGGNTEPLHVDHVRGTFGACAARLERLELHVGPASAAGALLVSSRGDPFPVAIEVERVQALICDESLAAIAPASLLLEPWAIVLEPAAIDVTGGRLIAAGSAATDGELWLAVEGEALDLSQLLALAGLPAAAAGRVGFRSSLALVPSPGEAPERRGSLEIFLREGACRLPALSLGEISASSHLSLDGERLELRDLALDCPLGKLAAEATLPLRWPGDGSLAPGLASGAIAEARLGLELNDLGALARLGQSPLEIGGRAAVSLSANGPLEPGLEATVRGLDISGRLAVREGSLRRLDPLPPLSELGGEVRLESGVLSIETLGGKLLDAGFTLSGAVDLGRTPDLAARSNPTFDLRLLSSDLLLLSRPDLRARGDVDVHLGGSWQSPRLVGEILVKRAYSLTDVSLTPSRGTRLPLRLFSFREPPLSALELGLHLRSDRGLSLRNNLVSTRATLDLFLAGTGFEPVLTGVVSTDEGEVRLADSTLRLQGSFVEFLRDDPLNPRLQIHLGETIRGYNIHLAITGTLESPEVLIDSTPPLEREKALVLVTTGLTIDEIEERGVGRVAAVKAAKYVGHRIARYLSNGDPSERSFLDRFSLETESAREARMEDPIRVEYRLIDKLFGRESNELFLQGERDTYGDYNFNVGVRFQLD